jgi:hypothetical protein
MTDSPFRDELKKRAFCLDSFRAFYLRIPPEHIVHLKFLFESYEGLGVIRTLNRDRADIAVLALEHEEETIISLLDSIAAELALRPLEPPKDLSDDWLLSDLGGEDIGKSSREKEES